MSNYGGMHLCIPILWSKQGKNACKHACTWKQRPQGLGPCDLGLRPPPPMCKVKQEGPPKLKNMAALLSPPFWSPAPLSLPFGASPLSLAIRWQGHMKGKVQKPLRPRFQATNGPRPPPKIWLDTPELNYSTFEFSLCMLLHLGPSILAHPCPRLTLPSFSYIIPFIFPLILRPCMWII